MICPHCGRLNQNDAETCVGCRRALAAPDEACAVHSDRPAVAYCSRCDTALCEECRVLVGGSPYCLEHADSVSGQAEQAVLRTARVVDVTERRVATFAQRVQAGLIDVTLAAVYLVILYIALWAVIGSPPSHPDAGGWRVLFWLMAVLGPVGYLVYENASGGRTVGKELSDLIALREDGTMMDFDTAALRSLLSVLSLLLGGIGFWVILWDPRCRALHDRWTHTIVIQD
jgi:uncharacterized RDD family membrane protein YckC